jgi:GntR family transcriptional regulator
MVDRYLFDCQDQKIMKASGDYINLYFDLYWTFKSQIILKDLPPGSRIPTIEELHEQHEVSHGTVRKAMELLEREDLIIRRPGLGTFVKQDVELPVWTYEKSIEEIYSVLRNLRIEPIGEAWIEPPRRIRSIFNDYNDSFDNEQICHVKRLTISPQDEQRRMVTDIYSPAWVMDGIELDILRNAEVHETVANLKGLKASHVSETIRPWICDKVNGELLGVVAGMPLFHRTSVTTNKEKRILFIRETLTTANILVLESDIE